MMGVISFVHFRFANLIPRNSPANASSSTLSRTNTRNNTRTAAPSRTNGTVQASVKTVGIPVRSSCIRSFERSTCQGLTGSDWASQMLFPSSEMDGTAISLSEAAIQANAQYRAVAHPLPAPNTPSSASVSPLPFSSIRTPIAGISRMPSPQFSIYVGFARKCRNSRPSNAPSTLFCLAVFS